jgi:hypothetical protein
MDLFTREKLAKLMIRRGVKCLTKADLPSDLTP